MMTIEKCIGRIVILIYQDKKGSMITKRQIRVSTTPKDGVIQTFDLAKKAYRSLRVETWRKKLTAPSESRAYWQFNR